MIVTGRCRGNGAQLADYWMNSPENERAEVLGIFGTATPNHLKRSLIEMSLTSELSDRTDAGLYHAQISPRAHEAATMTVEQKIRAGEILAEHLGLAGQKWAIMEQVIDGRLHLHVAYERYNHDTGLMWLDDNNYEKHMAAARQMEIEFEHQITHEQKNILDKDIKDHILNLWNKYQEPADFVKAMDKAGFEVTQGTERPYQIVDQYGTVHNLTRQLADVKQADVSGRLNPYRNELRPSPEASKERRREYQAKQLEAEFEQAQVNALKQIKDLQSAEKTRQPEDDLHDVSNSQDLAQAMLDKVKQPDKDAERDTGTLQGYGDMFTQPIHQPPTLSQQPAEQTRSADLHETSESQDLAAAMIEYRRQQQATRENKVQEAQQQAAEQTSPANDNQPQKYYNPATGLEMTKEAYNKMQEFLERARQREQERNDRKRGGLEY
jgi:hypothetical protein